MAQMSASEWLSLLAAVGHLALAVLSVVRGRGSPVARRLAALCFALFCWNFTNLGGHASGVPLWDVAGAISTALSPPLTLDLVATFVGPRPARGRLVVVAYAFFAALAVSSAAGFFSEWGRWWCGSSAWAFLFLGMWVPALGLSIAWLVRHLVETAEPDEKARTRTFLAAIAFGGALATTDELADLGLRVLPLGALGTLAGTLLVATAVFRFRLFDRDLSLSTAIYVASLASVAIAFYLVAFRLLGGGVATFASAAAFVTLVLVAAAREVSVSRAAQQERLERLAVLGRLSAQMAHDIRNPLAALKGAAQLLENAPPAQPEAERRQFLKLVVDQADRIRAILEKYERIGRVELVASRVQINEVVGRVVAAQRLAATHVDVALDLLEPLPECDADADLLAGALENVLRNAFEAMPKGGRLQVKTRTESPPGGSAAVVVRVEDTGEGMDARRAARAFDDFYTTKARGSGLGLAFVRRVAMAHGGDVSLVSRLGVGTTVELRLPAAASQPAR
jgi:signal transduction histidine kinase